MESIRDWIAKSILARAEYNEKIQAELVSLRQFKKQNSCLNCGTHVCEHTYGDTDNEWNYCLCNTNPICGPCWYNKDIRTCGIDCQQN